MLCAQCGGQLKETSNFCKYCGSKVNRSESKEQPDSYKPEIVEKKYEKTEPSLFDQAILANDNIRQPQAANQDELMDPYLNQQEIDNFDPITDEIIDVLYSREREIDIKSELKEILTEVEKIEQRLNIGLVSEIEASSIIREKQNLISLLRTERKSLKLDKIIVEILNEELADIKDKLDKLHIMKNEGKITNESVYEKLKNEYSESYKEKTDQSERQSQNMANWLKILQLDVHKMKEDIDIFKTKSGIGEIDQNEADTKIKSLEIDIYRKELAYHSLKKIENKINN